MVDKETIDSQEQVEEGMGDMIRLGALLALLAVPGVSSAEEISKKLPNKASIEATDIRNAMNLAAPKKTYSGYSIQQAANIVARTLYDEARGEGTNGVDAVASVIYNRAGGKAENLPAVCLRKYQFSKWNDQTNLDPKNYTILIPTNAKKTGKDKEMWLYCQKTAGKLIFGEFKSTIGNLNSYHTTSVNPNWDASLKNKKTIGNHVFGYLPEYDGFSSNEVLKMLRGKKLPGSSKKKLPINKLQKNSTTAYTIKNGDTLRKIAQAKNTTVDKILKLNPKIKNQNKIKVGMKIKLPS